MSDQSKLGLGQIITGEQSRDAIHIAVAPLECGDCKAWPGVHVGVRDGKFSEEIKPHVGIVDPFLEKAVYAEQKAWIYLYPGSITSLRHVWSHPAFGEATEPIPAPQDPNQEHIDWITSCARNDCDGMSYEQLMDAADNFVESETYLVQGGRFEGTWLPQEFWVHYQAIRKVEVPENRQTSFFSCSC